MSARLRRPRLLRPLLLAAGVYAGLAAVAPVAEAAVMGRNGLEIQGPNDRRGFYVGVGLGFGASYFDSPFFARTYKDATAFIPAGRLELSLGGGVGKRVTLGGTLHLGTYFSGRFGGARAFFGGDVEANIFVVRGFFIRTGLGISGVPRGDGRGILMGAGGLAGVGYEFWLNTTAALGVSAIYDIRAVPGDGIRHTPYVGLRFSWY